MVLNSSIFGSILGILAVEQIVMITIQIMISFFEIYIMIKIFNKAGQSPILSIIPIVNRATLLKISNMSPIWVIVPILSILCNICEVASLGVIIYILEFIVIGIIMNVKLAKAFDLPGVFAVGLIILPTVFYAIIAFGPFNYTGTREQKEKIDNMFKLNGNKNKDYVPRSDFFRD